MTRKISARVVMALMLLPVLAIGSQEDHLLQSWGMQQDASGRLVFSQPMPTQKDAYQPWQPQHIAPPLTPPANAVRATGLQPLVVSSSQPKQP